MNYNFGYLIKSEIIDYLFINLVFINSIEKNTLVFLYSELTTFFEILKYQIR